MRIIFLYLSVLTLFTSCGAAKNSKGRAKEPAPSNQDRANQTASSKEFQSTLRSHMFRNKESQQLNYSSERKLIASNKLPKTHRTTPDVDRDLDSNVVMPEKISSPELGCGNYSGIEINQVISISARHNNCKDIHGDINALTWSGEIKGISGEGDWQLISNSSYTENDQLINKIVWQDLTTGLLWGDLTPRHYSWEEASGIKNSESRPCLAKSDSPKHELGRIHPSLVAWRMPNRNEFLQADLNGSRFVLPNSKDYIWTASYGGTFEGVDKAWAIKLSTGELSLMPTSTELATRCIGVVLK